MGCWDCFCFICGNSCHEPFKTDDDEYNVPNDFKKKLKWLNKCTFLTQDNKIIHGCKEVGCNIEFEDKNKNTYEQLMKYNVPNSNYKQIPLNTHFQYGIFLHTDCWRFIKKEYNLELKYGDLPIFYSNIGLDKIFTQIDYGIIEKYWSQDFDFKNLYTSGMEYLSESPLTNKKNALRIKRNVSKLKIKNNNGRKSPITSATFYKENDIKIGCDGEFWIKSGSKWNKMSGKIITKKIIIKFDDKKQINLINNIPQIGYFNTKPIFIKSIKKNQKEFDISVVMLKND